MVSPRACLTDLTYSAAPFLRRGHQGRAHNFSPTPPVQDVHVPSDVAKALLHHLERVCLCLPLRETRAPLGALLVGFPRHCSLPAACCCTDRHCCRERIFRRTLCQHVHASRTLPCYGKDETRSCLASPSTFGSGARCSLSRALVPPDVEWSTTRFLIELLFHPYSLAL